MFFMLCEKVIGSIKDEKYKNYKVDYVNIEWHDAFKKIHKITTDGGIEVGIKLDDSILIRGLR
ncbi:MAG: urease accessory protein UreE, partial [Clostridium butyricum]